MLAELYRAFELGEDEIARRLDGDLKRTPCEILAGRSPTVAMQGLGTEWGRDLIASDLWTRWWIREAEACRAEGIVAINDSVRFPDEADAVRALGGVVIHLEGRSDLPADHVSETDTIEADATLGVDHPPVAVARAVLEAAGIILERRQGDGWRR